MEVVEITTKLLATLTLTLLVGVLTVRVADYFCVPDIILLLLVGVAVGPVLHLLDIPADSVTNQIILLGGAAYILFHGGTSIDLKVVAPVWKTIVLLATLGVLVTAGVTGLAASSFIGLPLLSGFLLASVIASTDPATLIPVFHQVKVKAKLAQTVISESTLNDATGASLVLALVPVALGTAAFSVGGASRVFLTQAGVGALVGFALGALYIVAVAERWQAMAAYAPKLSIVTALLSFVVADHFHGSGFMAAFVAGLLIGNAHAFGFPVSEATERRLHHFMESNAAIFRIFIFILLGSHVDFGLLRQHLGAGLGVIAVFLFVARPLTVLACALPDRRGAWQWRELLFLFWVRETGVIPAALAGVLLAMKVPHADVIASITFLAVVVTIVVQAGTTGMLARRLGVLEEPPSCPSSG